MEKTGFLSCWLPLVKPLSWEPKAVLRRAVAGIRRLLYDASPAANRSDCFPFLVLFQCPTAHRFEQVVAEQGKNDGDELFHGFGIQRGSFGIRACRALRMFSRPALRLASERERPPLLAMDAQCSWSVIAFFDILLFLPVDFAVALAAQPDYIQRKIVTAMMMSVNPLSGYATCATA